MMIISPNWYVIAVMLALIITAIRFTDAIAKSSDKLCVVSGSLSNFAKANGGQHFSEINS